MEFTQYRAQMTPITLNDAGFRLWGKSFTDMLDMLGFTQVYSDIDWTTILMPTSAVAWAGKRVYKFNDALSATREIYFSVEFGRGSTSANSFSFAIRLTIGLTHDGSGVVSDYVMQQYLSAASPITDGGFIYGVKSNAGFLIYTSLNTTNHQVAFGIERLCVSKEPTPDGAVLMYSGQACDNTGSNSTSIGLRTANYHGGQVFNVVGRQSTVNSDRAFMNYQGMSDSSDPSYSGKAPAITFDTFGKYDPCSHYIAVSKMVYSPATEFTAIINGETGTYYTPLTGILPENGSLSVNRNLCAIRTK